MQKSYAGSFESYPWTLSIVSDDVGPKENDCLHIWDHSITTFNQKIGQ